MRQSSTPAAVPVPVDPLAWAIERDYRPEDVESAHYVLGYVRAALKQTPNLSRELRDALTLIEAHCAMRDMRIGGAK